MSLYMDVVGTPAVPPIVLLNGRSLPFQSKRELSLTEKEDEAVEAYTDGNSLWMNNLLRRTASYASLDRTQKTRLCSDVSTLTQLIYRARPSTAAVTVYRGTESMRKEWVYSAQGMELPFTDKAFISTTFDPEVALSFADNNEGHGGVLLVLNLPKGTRGLYLGDTSVWNEESELLLPPMTKFVIDKNFGHILRGVGKELVLVIQATLVSQPYSPAECSI